MSRSGYHDGDGDYWADIRWRGAVASALRGERGQTFLKELRAVMDATPKKELIASDFQAHGSFCTLGLIANARGVDMSDVTEEKYDWDVGLIAGKRLDIAEAMAKEIMYMNDEAGWYEDTPVRRWNRMRTWVEAQIKEG